MPVAKGYHRVTPRKPPSKTHTTRGVKLGVAMKRQQQHPHLPRLKPRPGHFALTADHLQQILEHPHLLGHLVGKTKLTELHSKWIWEVWGAPSGEPTALQAHRGAFKTTAVTEIGCVWWLLFHPNDRIALVRETFTAANDTLKTIKAYIKSEPIRALFKLAHKLYPKTIINKSGTVTYTFKKSITKEGSIDAYGIEQVPTGSHYDRIICDDIITINSRLSRAKRERVKEGVREILTNIIDPGKSVHIIGTPWHHDDAWSMTTEDGGTIIPTPFQYRPEDTGILSAEELAEKRRRTSKALFAINYMLDTSIRDDGQIFDDEPIRGVWDDTRPSCDYYAHLDAKFEGTCTNALTIMCRLPSGFIQVTGWTFPEHIDKKVEWVRSTLMRYRCSKLWIETNPDKGYVAKMFKRPSARGRLSVYTYHEDMNKHIKIITYLKDFWPELVWANNIDNDYLLQVLDYREGQEPMDCPDSASSLLARVFYHKDHKRSNNTLNEL